LETFIIPAAGYADEASDLLHGKDVMRERIASSDRASGGGYEYVYKVILHALKFDSFFIPESNQSSF
jgi:hypothetical protein